MVGDRYGYGYRNRVDVSSGGIEYICYKHNLRPQNIHVPDISRCYAVCADRSCKNFHNCPFPRNFTLAAIGHEQLGLTIRQSV